MSSNKRVKQEFGAKIVDGIAIHATCKKPLKDCLCCRNCEKQGACDCNNCATCGKAECECKCGECKKELAYCVCRERCLCGDLEKDCKGHSEFERRQFFLTLRNDSLRPELLQKLLKNGDLKKEAECLFCAHPPYLCRCPIGCTICNAHWNDCVGHSVEESREFYRLAARAKWDNATVERIRGDLKRKRDEPKEEEEEEDEYTGREVVACVELKPMQ